eukprot:TRINITY_DN3840_c0_g1_i1.p1 TRINITY_DN3840_c0_g1~~TRINITY_DN3840_c0_g1_i1.p1  ORF type:complete len:676 (+),score=190.67 TRINITY_DN3840_c0_g1_i1:294-2321(+)
MLVLFETPAGFALFKLHDEGKLQDVNNLYKDFETFEKASKVVSLQKFHKFESTADALVSTTALVESKLSKDLRKFLKKAMADSNEALAVADSKLGNIIKEKLDIKCVSDTAVFELMRGIRSQINNLITGLADEDMNQMALGLSHSLSRYKLKFSPDKVDTMIIQAISLLDDLDKELNIYAMRVREWYGWHFPELGKIVTDNLMYARTVKTLGIRTNVMDVDLSQVIPNELIDEVKEAAQMSMGTEISAEDIENVEELCEQVISITEYREQLYDYLKNRMQAIAPNLTVLVGELVGARLIAQSGSLLTLAKFPASTIQILGAEKALFRALKSKHNTPKYGLIFHASLVGQTNSADKGKMSRLLAAKCALSVRVDALGDATTATIGIQNRLKVEQRARQLETSKNRISGLGKKGFSSQKYDSSKSASNPTQLRAPGFYAEGDDVTLRSNQNGSAKKQNGSVKPQDDETMPEFDPNVPEETNWGDQDGEQAEETPKKEKKDKKEKKEKKEKKKDKKKRERQEEEGQEGGEVETPSKEEKKKKKKANSEQNGEVNTTANGSDTQRVNGGPVPLENDSKNSNNGNGDSNGSSNASSSQNKDKEAKKEKERVEVIEMSIEIHEGEVVTLRIYEGDIPRKRAFNFCYKYGLDRSCVDIIAKSIVETLNAPIDVHTEQEGQQQ